MAHLACHRHGFGAELAHILHHAPDHSEVLEYLSLRSASTLATLPNPIVLKGPIGSGDACQPFLSCFNTLLGLQGGATAQLPHPRPGRDPASTWPCFTSEVNEALVQPVALASTGLQAAHTEYIAGQTLTDSPLLSLSHCHAAVDSLSCARQSCSCSHHVKRTTDVQHNATWKHGQLMPGVAGCCEHWCSCCPLHVMALQGTIWGPSHLAGVSRCAMLLLFCSSIAMRKSPAYGLF